MRKSLKKSCSKTKMADLIEGDEEDAYKYSLFLMIPHIDSKFEGFDLDGLTIVANVHAVFAIDLC